MDNNRHKSVLHIISYYTGQRLYTNLISSLNAIGLNQKVFIPVRNKDQVGKFQLKGFEKLQYLYALVLKPYHRLFYFSKVSRSYRALTSGMDVSSVALTHAHSMFSDGGVALKLKMEYGIPFIVAVRSTDLNIFFKYMLHLRPFGLKILQEASAIIFINPSYRKRMFDNYIPIGAQQSLMKKCICIPNGIDNFWHETTHKGKKMQKGILNLLYVGTFIRRKNLPLVIKAAYELNEKYDVTLKIVGGAGRRVDPNVMKTVEKYKKLGLKIEVVGKIENQQQIRTYYRDADIFVMPSYNETFGLVYIEALSQGTPIIYTRNDGVDGFFKEGDAGFAVRGFSVPELTSKIEEIISNYEGISSRCVAHIQSFKWGNISSAYKRLYEEIVTND